MSKISNTRGLLYEPTYENEVILLFGLLIPYFKDDFVIDSYSGSFPDCIARQNGEEIGVEFEVFASDFYNHRHNEHPNLSKCKLLVCWKNDLERETIVRCGRSFIIVKGRVNDQEIKVEIEVLALKKIVDELRGKGIILIMNGERPGINEANKERFFEQLKENVDEQKLEWIKELYDKVDSQKEMFEVRWSGGERLFTMRFFVRKWGVDPIGVSGDGKVWLSYAGNPAINPWQLPSETENALRQMFKRKKENEKWHTIPLNSKEDLNKIKKALDIIAEHSMSLALKWQK